MHARLRVLGLQEECLALNPSVTRREICAGTEEVNFRPVNINFYRDSIISERRLQGDSGGPLVLDGVQVGVASYIFNGVGGYTNLADEVTHAWILSHIYQ